MSANDIVTLNVTQQQPPAPSQLQRSGALVTQGGTTTSAGTLTLLTQFSDLAAILGSPGAAVDELTAMATTFFANGSQISVYVLELGTGAVSAGVTALTSFLAAQPNKIYGFLLPVAWDSVSQFIAFLANYNATTAKTYFHVTTTTTNYVNYTALTKCVVLTVPSPGKPSTEFTAAAQFWVTLNWNPSSANKVPPLAFSFVYGVTPYPLAGNLATLATLKGASVGYIDTGAEGGISNAILKWGKTRDGKTFNYWYAVDWSQINLQLDIANAVINGSNTDINPLYYDQPGINVLQDVATRTLGNAVSYGLLTGEVQQTQLDPAAFVANYNAGLYRGQLVINAQPFLNYTAANPNDYAAGRYAGFQAVVTPSRNFESILFNVAATQFV